MTCDHLKELKDLDDRPKEIFSFAGKTIIKMVLTFYAIKHLEEKNLMSVYSFLYISLKNEDYCCHFY